MKILYHHRTQSEDAQGIHIQEMVKAFRDLGHEVEMAALVKRDTSKEEKGGGFWKWLTGWIPDWLYELMSFIYNFYGYRSLSKTIRASRPDLIYERYSLNTFCGVWASQHFKIPLVLEVNAPLYYEQKKLGRLTFKGMARFSERWICSNSTRTIVVTKVMKEMLIREGVPDDKLVVMHNGIDPGKLHPDVSDKEIRRKYGLKGKVVIGFVGWFRAWHGLEMLLEVVHEVSLAKQNVCLLLVGDGPAYNDLYSYVKTHDLNSEVIFTGSVEREEIAAHIAAMDIAVQPSSTEYACPMKIIEYMGMGKCIIAPDLPNIREILNDGINGCFFIPGDQKSLRATWIKMLDNPDIRKTLSQNAYKGIFERGFLWQSNAKKVLALVSSDF